MSYIEKYAYDWVTARDRMLKAKCTFDGKNFQSTDPEAWVLMARAEQALDRYIREWLGLEAGAGIEPAQTTSKDAGLPLTEPAKQETPK